MLWSDLSGADRAASLRGEGYFVAAQQAAAKLEAVVARAGSGDLAWGNIDSYLIFKLSGGAAHVTDRSQAWPTGYLDLSTMGWNQALIAHQRLDPAIFPRMVDTWGNLAETSPAVLGRAVPIAADIADQQAALVAHGGQAGVAKVSYGTSASLDLATGTELVVKDFSTPPFVVSSVGGDARFCVEGMVYLSPRSRAGLGARRDAARESGQVRRPGGERSPLRRRLGAARFAGPRRAARRCGPAWGDRRPQPRGRPRPHRPRGA